MPAAFDLSAIAREIMTAQDEVRLIAPITSRGPGFDLDKGAAVARLIHKARVIEGAVPIGRKLGFTNLIMWPRHGMRGPLWAHVYDTTVVDAVDGRATVSLGRFSQPKIEPEIVLRFHSDAPTNGDPAAVLRCIEWFAPGFEIVQSHCTGWKFEASDALADSLLHAALVVGEPQPLDRLGTDPIAALQTFDLALSCDGTVRDVGKGCNVLGSPLAAVALVASQIALQTPENRIRAGEIVTTGTVTAPWPVRAGETWSATLRGLALPGLEVRFSE